MTGREVADGSEEFIYRISTMEEWELLQKTGSTFGGDLDRTTGFIHLSKLDQFWLYCLDKEDFKAALQETLDVTSLQRRRSKKQFSIKVQPTLLNFFLNVKDDLYLLQIDAKKLGDGLVYEAVDNTNAFPHFYGPSRSFSPLPLDTVIKGEKLVVSDGKFVCSILS